MIMKPHRPIWTTRDHHRPLYKVIHKLTQAIERLTYYGLWCFVVVYDSLRWSIMVFDPP